MRVMHVNSSMPRSGSELLQALLAQHPEVYASATSPLLEYWFGAYGNFGMAEVKSQDPGLMREAFLEFCRRGADGYYSALTDRPCVIDKSRGWLEYAEWLWDVFPESRVVCMTRPLPEIKASLERIYRAHTGHPETRDIPVDPQARDQYWAHPQSKPLGLALSRFKHRRMLGDDPRIMYVGYNALCDRPVETMRDVFRHLNLDPVDIDPNNVCKAADEDDCHYGIFGQHELRPIVGRRKA